VGDHTSGNIAAPGDWMSFQWDECQETSLVVMGYGWLAAGTPGRICPVPDALLGELGVLNCGLLTYDEPFATACAGICGAAGDEPGGPAHTVPTTWGSIKAMFK
jgi:hypothetical protein